MARDIEAEVKVKDSTGPGLASVEEKFKRTGKNIEKEYDRFGKATGDKLIGAIGAVSPRLAAQIASAVGDGAGLAGPLLISGLGVAMPAVGALIGAAVTGGSAGLGIVGGVALAVRDQRVKQAGTTMAANLLSGLSDRAGSFVQPVLRSIDILEDQFIKSGDTIKRIFTNSSRFVEPLTRSLAHVGESLLEGLDTAVSRAGPVMDALNDGLEGTGDAVRSFFEQASAAAGGNAAALRDTFEAINGLIIAAGFLVRILGEVYGALSQLGLTSGLLQQLTRAFDDTDEAARRTGSGTFGAAESIRTAGAAAEIAARDTQLYEAALRENEAAAKANARAQSSLFDDATRVGAAMDDAAAAARRNGRTLDANTTKGRANRQSLSQLAGALRSTQTNLESAGASTQKLSSNMASNRQALIRTATQMGATKAQARALATQLLGIPPKRETKTNLLNAAKTKAEARSVKGATDAIPRSIPIRVSIITTGLTAAREAANLRREMLSLSAHDSFAFAGGDGSSRRTGGPLEVRSTVENHLYLDGRPFRQYTDDRLTAYHAKERHRARYGGKY